MNEAVRISTDGLLTTGALAARPDFTLGLAAVSPSTRSIAGPGGTADVEPRVMQVLVVLAEAAGQVVTRETLFNRCWGGVYVGDDSLNRAIGAVRKLALEVADGSFRIETIPRTGYRLMGPVGPVNAASLEDGSTPPQMAVGRAPAVSRRLLVGGGIALAAVGGGGLWWTQEQRRNSRFDALMARGEEATRLDDPAAPRYFEQAVAIHPNDARAWGLLAYTHASGVYGGAVLSGPAAQATEQAARKALQLDPRQPDALLARAMVQSNLVDWFQREQTFRDILAIDPANPRVLQVLGSLLHAVGRCRASLAIVEKALAVEPLAPDHWMRKALRLWVLGRVAEADPVIDRALQFWPSHPLVRLGRLMIYAFTGRAAAALAMIEEEEARPTFVTAAGARFWRASLPALRSPEPAAVAAARYASLTGSRGSPQIAAWAILTMSALGELDAAFEVANGFLLDRGSIIVRPRPDPKLAGVNNAGWRNTFGLFTPPTRALRLDRRFGPLADGLGLTEYWRRRGVGPDAFLFAS